MLSGFNIPAKDLINQLSQIADYVLAIGTCAAYGGITAAGENITDATGLQFNQSQAGVSIAR